MAKKPKQREKKRFVLIRRVSTTKQATQGHSMEEQLATAQAWCQIHDAEIVADPAATRTDGLSGAADVRPDIEEALTLIRTNQADGILVTKLDRLARTTLRLLELTNELKEYGAHLVSVRDSIDTTSPHGRFFFTMMAGLAELERDITSERTTATKQHRKELGFSTSKDTPYGFSKDPETRKLCVNPVEQAMIQWLTKQYQSTPSCSAVARIANEQGYRMRNGNAWHHEQVKRIVSAHSRPTASHSTPATAESPSAQAC